MELKKLLASQFQKLPLNNSKKAEQREDEINNSPQINEVCSSKSSSALRGAALGTLMASGHCIKETVEENSLTKIDDTEIDYYGSGRVAKIGDMEIDYYGSGRLAKIGDMKIDYYGSGRLAKIGDTEIDYYGSGRVSKIAGNINEKTAQNLLMCITCSLLNNQTNDNKKSFLASLIINALNNQQIENNHLILALALQKADIFSVYSNTWNDFFAGTV